MTDTLNEKRIFAYKELFRVFDESEKDWGEWKEKVDVYGVIVDSLIALKELEVSTQASTEYLNEWLAVISEIQAWIRGATYKQLLWKVQIKIQPITSYRKGLTKHTHQIRVRGVAKKNDTIRFSLEEAQCDVPVCSCDVPVCSADSSYVIAEEIVDCISYLYAVPIDARVETTLGQVFICLSYSYTERLDVKFRFLKDSNSIEFEEIKHSDFAIKEIDTPKEADVKQQPANLALYTSTGCSIYMDGKEICTQKPKPTEKDVSALHRRILVNILEIGNSDAFKKKVSKHFSKIKIGESGSINMGAVRSVFMMVDGKCGLGLSYISICRAIHVQYESHFQVYISGPEDIKLAFSYLLNKDGEVLECHLGPILDHKLPVKQGIYVWNDILDRIVDWIVVGRDRVRRGLSYE